MNTNDINKRVVDLDINDVLPNRFQPRVKFNEDAIIELSESIKEHGIIQPIIVRPIGDKYEIIAGERRYKASILAGKDSIPAIITDLNDKDSAEIALIENVQRKNLTPIEEAVSYKKILDMGYLTQEQLALKLGRSQSSIANKMRLLHLSDEVQEALVEEKISERHARSLLKLNSPEQQNEMLGRIINERLTVRKTDEEIDKMMNNPVAEVDSSINQGAFINSNPGFVDVNKIENEAREINNNSPKIDINALLQPDASKPIEPPKQEKNTITSSLFNLFSKQDTEKKEEPKKEESFYSNPYGSFSDTNKPLDTNAVYNFEPIPGLNDSKPIVEDKPQFTQEDIKPITDNIVEQPIKPESQNVEIVEPIIPSIDLSKFDGNQNNIADKNESVIPSLVTEPVSSTPMVDIKPEVIEPVIPVVETKEEVVNTTPIIITDYDKQYDPIMPNISKQQDKANFNQVISIIRNATSDVEKTGYKIDTDEIDLGSEYRVIITIKKDN